LTVSGTLLKIIYNDVSTGRFPVLIKLIYGDNNKLVKNVIIHIIINAVDYDVTYQ